MRFLWSMLARHTQTHTHTHTHNSVTWRRGICEYDTGGIHQVKFLNDRIVELFVRIVGGSYLIVTHGVSTSVYGWLHQVLVYLRGPRR
jgi:hypothetical protein